MANPISSGEDRKLIWAHVHQQLLRHAVPDSRFDYDFLSFTPDFRGSSSAVERVVSLPCYEHAKTLLVTSDNSLEQLRYRALVDGKKVLVATHNLRRGFVFLNPARMGEDKYTLASCLDGLEKPGLGRSLSLMQIMDENICIDLCIIGGLAFNRQGVMICKGPSRFELQWALLQDIKCLAMNTQIVAVAHACQVVDETQMGLEKIIPDGMSEVQCDFVVTPGQVYEVEGPLRLPGNVDFNAIENETCKNTPPLQELKGIRMMEKIMKDGGLGQENEKDKPALPSAEEQMGIEMVEKLMKGYKP